MQQCQNGHLYDDSKSDICPYCGSKLQYETTKNIENIFPGYSVSRKLGSGSLSEVYLLESCMDSMEWALKVVDCKNDPLKLEAAKREFELMKKADECPHTLSVFDMKIVNEDSATVVYILEELAIPILRYYKPGDINLIKIKQIMTELCDALKFLSRAGIRHLDIKPDNIYVSADGKIKLGDFSHAQYVSELSSLKEVRGTDVFMAPEIYEKNDYNNTTEIYSLGMVLYYLLTGTMLFRYEDRDRKIRKAEDQYPATNLNKVLLDIVKKATAYLPENRYADYTDFMSDIMSIPRGMKITGGNNPEHKDSLEPEKGWGNIEEFACSCVLQTPVRETACLMPDMHGNAKTECWSNANTHTSKENTADAVPVSFPQTVPTDCSSAVPIAPEVYVPEPTVGGSSGTEKKSKSAKGLIDYLGGFFKKKRTKTEDDLVQFRAAAPAVFNKDAYSQVKIMMYREDDHARADRETSRIADKTTESSSGVFSVPKYETLRIVLQSQDIPIEDDIREFAWNGIFSECTFDVYVPGDYNKKQIRFKGRVYRGQAVLTDLSLIVSVESDTEQCVMMEKCALATAFVSYASKDRSEVVARIQGIQAARKDMDIFLDVEKLRCGEDWQKRLYKEIEQRSIFYLFWSLNASQSEWVKKELKHAISFKGVDCVEPIPLDSPEVCPPPEELKEKHFNDWTLRYLGK